MTREDCKNFRELLAANALTALDAEDARALETHLAGCAECRAEMNEWQQTAALLALDASPIEPSPEVRQRVLANAHAAGSDVASARIDERIEPTSSADGSKVLAFERSRKNVWSSLGSLGAIAAALAFVALLLSLVLIWQQNRATRKELARLSTEVKEAKDQLARAREAMDLLSSPGARLTRLSGTEVAPGAHAMLAYDKNGHAMLMAKGLPAAPKGMAYQLWYIVGKKPMPGKVFSTDAAGNASLEDQLPMPARDSAVFAVTLEPEGGVQAPTGKMYLSSSS
jgi:anti-sigma-K factor RskA